MNLNISTEFGYFKSAPTYICERLNLKKGTYWIMCLAKVLDLYKPSKLEKTKSVEVFDLIPKKVMLFLINYSGYWRF